MNATPNIFQKVEWNFGEGKKIKDFSLEQTLHAKIIDFLSYCTLYKAGSRLSES